MKITFYLNGKKKEADVPSDKRVIDLLRENFNILDIKSGCTTGDCGYSISSNLKYW